MASFNKGSLVFVAVSLVFFAATTLADTLPPGLAPFADHICDKVECGKGTCKSELRKPLGFTCECEDGWKKSRDDDVDDFFKFLPCIIPDCSLNYTCQGAPPPVPEKEPPLDRSSLDPCTWIYCGEGECKRGGDFKHRCECNNGSSNLLNMTHLPCYSPCTIGSDCSRLGINVSDAEASPSEDGRNQAISFLPGKLHWMAVLVVSMAMILWK